jgi:hypothetical protein
MPPKARAKFGETELTMSIDASPAAQHCAANSLTLFEKIDIKINIMIKQRNIIIYRDGRF